MGQTHTWGAQRIDASEDLGKFESFPMLPSNNDYEKIGIKIFLCVPCSVGVQTYGCPLGSLPYFFSLIAVSSWGLNDSGPEDLLVTYYGMNVCISSKFILESHTPYCDGVRMWGLWKVIWFRWGHRMEPTEMGLVPLYESGERLFPLISLACEDTPRSQQSATQKRAFNQICPCWHLYNGLAVSRTKRNKFPVSLSSSQSMVFCFSSLIWLRHGLLLTFT